MFNIRYLILNIGRQFEETKVFYCSRSLGAMLSTQEKHLVVPGYIRRVQEIHRILFPIDIIKIIGNLYPQFIKFEGNTVELTDTEKCMITEWFIEIFELQNKSHILLSRLLYDYEKDGKQGTDFNQHCVSGKNT